MAQSTSIRTWALFALFVLAVGVFTVSVLIASPAWGALTSLAAGFAVVRVFTLL